MQEPPETNYRLVIEVPDYGMDIGWNESGELEEILKLLVDSMEECGGIEPAMRALARHMLRKTRGDFSEN